jgi:hypothetical protein
MKLKLFGKTLSNKAFTWYKALPVDTTDSWKNLSSVLLNHFYLESLMEQDA